MDEIWAEELRLQKRWDNWLSGRPVCLDCGRHIAEARAVAAEGGLICIRCIRGRTVDVDG